MWMLGIEYWYLKKFIIDKIIENTTLLKLLSKGMTK